MQPLDSDESDGDIGTSSLRQRPKGRRKAIEKAFLELCIPQRKKAWILEEIDNSSKQSDGQVFAAIRRLYYSARHDIHILNRFGLFEPRGANFVKVRLGKKPNRRIEERQGVAIMNHNDFPPKREVDEHRYWYDPAPMDEPPMPADEFMHYFNTPAEAHPNRAWTRRFPQKLQNSLLFSTELLAPGWAIEITEGPNWLLVCVYNFIGVFVSGFVAGVYAVVKQDNTTGVAIGAWLTALQALLGAMLFFRWS
ncbi:hypothetical protein MMC17_006828 [Xylographa soralifera]|nr:hypothetical protein [Xylographa soralifera]